MSQKRLDYLDMAKGLGIFFVVLGHIEFIQEGTLRWIFSFHMPLFFVIAGVLAWEKQEQEESVCVVLKKKAQGALIPYVSFSLILLTMSATGYILQPGSITGAAFARQLIDALTGYGLHILWFLPAYFLAGCGFFLLNKYQKPWLRNITIILLPLGSLWISDLLELKTYVTWEASLGVYALWNLLIVFLRALLAQPFLLIGWYTAKRLEKMNSVFKRELPILILLGSLLSSTLPIFDLHYLYVQPAHYLSAACTCIGILYLMKALPVSRVLAWFGRNSLIIMCTHASLYVIYYVSLGLFFVRKFIPMTDPIFNLTVAVLVCITEVPIIWIFNRYFSHLLGKNKE